MKTKLLKRLRRESRRMKMNVSDDKRGVDIFVNRRFVKKVKRNKSCSGFYQNPDISFNLIRECKEMYIKMELLAIRQRAHDKEFRDVVRMWERSNFC